MQIVLRRPGALVRRTHGYPASPTPLRTLALVVALSAACAPAHAEDAPAFDALLRQAQANAPRLLESAANVRAASAQARQAHAWPNPTLGVTAEDIGAPRNGGQNQRQDTYSLTQVFEIGAKRSARIEAEERGSAAVGARERVARLAYAGELAVAYATAEAMQLRREVAVAELQRARDDLRAAQALVTAGREAPLRLAQAQANTSAAEASLEVASAAAADALERLSALAGAAEPYTRIGQSFLIKAGLIQPDAQWQAADAPLLASAAADLAAASAQARAEQNRWLPDVGVTVGMRKYAWSSDKSATIGISASIPLFDRNKYGADAARERAASAAQRVHAARLETAAAHRSALVQVAAARRQLQAAEQGETAATEAYRLARIGYEAGKTSLLELLSVRRAANDARLQTIDAQLARVRALATLSMAEGRNVFGVSP